MSSWHSYPKIWALGHNAVTELLQGPVVIQEKLDGSQFSFGVLDGVVKCRSKGQELDCTEPKGMFKVAVDFVSTLPLVSDWTYRCEFMPRPRTNALTYERAALNALALYDINHIEEGYLPQAKVREEAYRLGIDYSPVYYEGDGSLVTQDMLNDWLASKPMLGGPMIEGIVIKNYTRYGEDKKVLMAKWVSEKFKEVHKDRWGQDKVTKTTTLQNLEGMFKTEARWLKAVQHLRERGVLTESPKDIGPLIAEVRDDTFKEETERIKVVLFNAFKKDIGSRLTRGLPEWYKGQLAERQFATDSSPS